MTYHKKRKRSLWVHEEIIKDLKSMELPVSFLLKFTIPQATPYRTEQIVCLENIALCPYLFICWPLNHAIWSSHRFPPTHPFRSLVYTLGQLLSCSSWLYNKKNSPQKLRRCLYCSRHLLWVCSGYPLLLGNCLTALQHFLGSWYLNGHGWLLCWVWNSFVHTNI